MRKVNEMEWYIFLIIGYVAGFLSPIIAMIIYALRRGMIKEAMHPKGEMK